MGGVVEQEAFWLGVRGLDFVHAITIRLTSNIQILLEF